LEILKVACRKISGHRPTDSMPSLAEGGAVVFLFIWIWFLSLFFLSSVQVQAQTGSHPEEDVKAAFIYNFTKFVEWPKSSNNDPNHDLVIGYWGNGSMMTALERLNGRKSQKKIIKVKLISGLCDMDDINVLVIGQDQTLDENMLMDLVKKNILTVSEGMDSLDKGIVIALYKEDDKIRFAINLKVMEGSKLRISSRLLKLAKYVIR